MAEQDEMFEIELENVEREFPVTERGLSADEIYDVTFRCSRASCWLEVKVTLDVKAVTTLEVVPRAMAEMHRAFRALAEQSAGWGPEAT